MRYFRNKHYFDAESSFIYGNAESAKAYGIMAWQWSQEGYVQDVGYFICRAVL